MGETRRCPECGSEVHLTARAEERLGKMDMGCANTDEHDGNGAVVMWPQEETDDGGTDVDDTDHLQEGDTVTVELEGEVIDLMEAHDDLARIDVDSQKVEILFEEIIDIEHPDRPAGVQEVQQDG